MYDEKGFNEGLVGFRLWLITLTMCLAHDNFRYHRKLYPLIVSYLTEPLVTVTSTCPNLLLEQTSTSGIILSTNNSDYNYNSNSNYYYDNDMDCQWNLTSGTKVELTFFTFNTELEADYLYVYDGGSSSSPMIGSFSGTYLPSPITSSSNKLHVRFTSDASERRRGFRASYRGKTYVSPHIVFSFHVSRSYNHCRQLPLRNAIISRGKWL